MKKFNVLFFACLVTVFSVQAQWSLQNNPQTGSVGKIQFVSAVEGWIAFGSNGTLLHTTNGGTTWNIVTPFPTDIAGNMSDPALSMSWVNPTHGWAIKTLSTGDKFNFNNATGAVVYKTKDGGITWERKGISTATGDFGLQIQFINENTGWALIYNLETGKLQLFKSTDGGSSWNSIIYTGSFGISHFTDANNGWSITRHSSNPQQTPEWSITHTADGGAHWSVQFTDVGNTNLDFNAIQFIDSNTGWVVGKGGKIFKTTNGGVNWTQITNAAITSVSNSKSVYFLDADNGWITNEEPSWPNHTILHTVNGGDSWTHHDPNFINGSMFNIFFWDKNNGWFTGEQSVNSGFNGIIGHFNNGFSGKEELKKGSMILYPNQVVNGFIADVGDHTASVSIYNVSGVLAFTTQITGKSYIDISTLPSSLYIIKTTTHKGTNEMKLIKE